MPQASDFFLLIKSISQSISLYNLFSAQNYTARACSTHTRKLVLKMSSVAKQQGWRWYKQMLAWNHYDNVLLKKKIGSPAPLLLSSSLLTPFSSQWHLMLWRSATSNSGEMRSPHIEADILVPAPSLTARDGLYQYYHHLNVMCGHIKMAPHLKHGQKSRPGSRDSESTGWAYTFLKTQVHNSGDPRYMCSHQECICFAQSKLMYQMCQFGYLFLFGYGWHMP